MQISNLLVGCRFGVALKALNIMLSMRLFDAAYKADGFDGVGEGTAVSQPKLQLQLEFNVNNCLQLHLFICTPFAQLSPCLLAPSPIPPFSPVPCHSWWWWWCRLCACAGQLATMSIGFALIRISFMHGIWPRLLFYFISFHFIPFEFFSTSLATPAPPHSPLYYDYHVLFNNWCANWQLSGSFTTLHTWWRQQQQQQQWQLSRATSSTLQEYKSYSNIFRKTHLTGLKINI